MAKWGLTMTQAPGRPLHRVTPLRDDPLVAWLTGPQRLRVAMTGWVRWGLFGLLWLCVGFACLSLLPGCAIPPVPAGSAGAASRVAGSAGRRGGDGLGRLRAARWGSRDGRRLQADRARSDGREHARDARARGDRLFAAETVADFPDRGRAAGSGADDVQPFLSVYRLPRAQPHRKVEHGFPHRRRPPPSIARPRSFPAPGRVARGRAANSADFRARAPLRSARPGRRAARPADDRIHRRPRPRADGL